VGRQTMRKVSARSVQGLGHTDKSHDVAPVFARPSPWKGMRGPNLHQILALIFTVSGLKSFWP
jgi:hypothetical protein